MKKLFYLFLLLPFTMFISCNDDKDFSPVDMTVTISGVTEVNDVFYTVAGENVTINNLTVKAIDGKSTDLANVQFSLDNAPIFPVPGSDTMASFSTNNLPAGTYSINAAGNLLQVDSPIKIFAVSYKLKVVESLEDLPDNAPEIATYSQTIRINNSK